MFPVSAVMRDDITVGNAVARSTHEGIQQTRKEKLKFQNFNEEIMKPHAIFIFLILILDHSHILPSSIQSLKLFHRE